MSLLRCAETCLSSSHQHCVDGMVSPCKILAHPISISVLSCQCIAEHEEGKTCTATKACNTAVS